MSSRLSPALALFPLRLFPGIIFADGTAGGFILRAFAVPHPGVAGVGVAITVR